MKKKQPKIKLSMNFTCRTALWISMDLLLCVIPSNIVSAAIGESHRVSKKMQLHDGKDATIVIDFTLKEFSAAVLGLEYACLYLDGAHRYFVVPLIPRLHQELQDYERIIRNMANDFHRIMREMES